MALRIIRVDDDPVLRKKSKVVKEIDDKLKTLISDMQETMEKSDGVGIAAVQVGILKRVVIIEVEQDGEWIPIVMINPEILEQSEETQTCMEGCLSVPGKQGDVVRPKKVKVKYLDIDGNEHTGDYEGLGAVVACHEIDHLEGVLYTDKALFVEDIPDVQEENDDEE